MRITTKGRYALRAVAQLAATFEGKPISIKDLAAQEALSPEFLEQIFFKLRKAGLINSTRGPGGGFSLKKDPADISLTAIFEAVGEGVDLTPCSGGDPEDCERKEECLTHDLWVQTSRHFREYFDGISVQDIVDRKYKL